MPTTSHLGRGDSSVVLSLSWPQFHNLTRLPLESVESNDRSLAEDRVREQRGEVATGPMTALDHSRDTVSFAPLSVPHYTYTSCVYASLW